jgi:hypothetical protein
MCMALPFVTCTVRRSGGAIMNVAGRGMVPARLLRDDFTNLGRGPQEFLCRCGVRGEIQRAAARPTFVVVATRINFN